VYEVDGHIGDLLRILQETGFDGSTVVALTADHGEYLGEHGLLEHSQLYDEVLSVPLLIRPPALRDQIRRPDVASTVDLVPTVLELLEVAPLPGSQGHSLLDEPAEARSAFAEWRDFRLLHEGAKPRPAQFQMSAQLENEKYVHDVLVPDASQLFDLSKDPEEANNLLAAGSERTARLRSIFENHLREDLPKGILGVEDVEIDDESMQMLRSLGYAR
jgi:choline-sulfatase